MCGDTFPAYLRYFHTHTHTLKAPDFSGLKDAAMATALLKALLSSKRLGPLIQYHLAKVRVCVCVYNVCWLLREVGI